MKRPIKAFLLFIMVMCISGCSANVNDLINDEKYEEALVIIEEDPGKYADIYDEVRYRVAETAFGNSEFEKVVSLLADNQYDGATGLLDEAKYHLALIAFQNDECDIAVGYLDGNSHAQATVLLEDIYFKLAENAIDNEDYEKAITLLADNSNENAAALLTSVYELKSAFEIDTFYNEMLSEIEAHNPDEWKPNFDYLDGTDYYLRISDMLNEVYDIIIRDNGVDNAVEKFTDIFGYEPTSKTQAIGAIEQLSNDMGFDKFYDSPFSYYQGLSYVMDTLTKHSDFVRFEMTSTSGFMVIEQPHQFLQEKGISARTFAYLLGTCKDMGAEISRDAERIIITFENIESDTYYSRGYFYCAPNSQHAEISRFVDNVGVSIDRWGLDEIGVWMDITLTNPTKHNLKFLSIDAVLINVNGEHLETASVLLKNVSDKEITFTLDFYDVTMDELIEKNCSVEFFPAVVLND